MTLIEQLERADGPDRELFRAAFVAVHGPKPPRIPGGSQELTDWLNLYNPFYRMLEAEAWTDAAMTLVPEGASWTMGAGGKERAIVTISAGQGRTDAVHGFAATPALALCIAALRARSQGGE